MFRLLALSVVLALCSTATAAPVLVTMDNYTTPVLPIVEDFDDGLVNTPGISIAAERYQIIAGGIGGGKAIEPTKVLQTLDGLTNLTELSFFFEEPWPTQVGFVTTQAAFPAENVSIVIVPVNLNSLTAPFAPNRFFGVTDPDGIQAIGIRMLTPVPGEPFFQIDDLQYVPEPSGAVLLAIGVAALLILSCRGHRDFRWLRAVAATLMMIVVIRQAVGITTSDSPANYEVKPGTGRDGIVHIAASNGNFGTGTLLPSGRHVWTASHIFEIPSITTTANVNFDLATGKKTIGATIAFQNVQSSYDFVILKLSDPAPIVAEKYEPYRNTGSEQKQIGQLVGYGRGGKGDVGETAGIPNPWIKREGSNKVDSITLQVAALSMDFDSGNVIHDTLGKGKDLGLGSAEACLALYDSGGPFLISNKLAGWAWTRDPVPGNSSFGQVMHYRQMSSFQGTYDQYVPPVVNSVIMSRQYLPYAAYTVPTGDGNQLRTVPVGGTNQIVVQFSEDMDNAASVSISGKSHSYSTGSTFATPRLLVINVDTYIDHFDGSWKKSDKLTITLGGLKKPGATGATLDGDWTNPTSLGDTNSGISRYPSGNGTPGTNLVFKVVVLPGDFDRDNDVDSDDYNIWWANQGSGTTFAQGDADGDGDVDMADYNIWLSNIGINWTNW